MHLETGFFHETGIPVIHTRREIPEAREIPEIWEIPGREKFEAIREGGNGNFPLNIPAEQGLVVSVGHPCSLREHCGAHQRAN